METLEEAMAEAVALSDEILIEPINDVLFVNPEERTIEIPETELLLGVYSDRNVERKYFKCPRIVGDNIDLSLCYMFINYVSSSGAIGQQQCNDVKLDETGNYITFSWLLSGNVFDKNIDSKVYFSVQAKMPNGENVFNTRKVSGDVYETVEAGEEITEEYADIILQIISRIDELEQGGGITQEQIEQALNKYLETNPIEVPTKLSDLQEDETHRTVTDVEKEQWNKAEENVQSDWNETDTTSDSFIKNKPSIPNKTSDLQNDRGFVTKAVNDLENYYKKTEIYTQEEVNRLISLIPKFSIEVVTSLPIENISSTTIYLVLSGEESSNLYTEYIYINGNWEILGTQTIDLSGYALKTDIPIKISDLINDSSFIESPSVAEVGQILEVEAIDETGKPTAWKVVNMPKKLPNPYALTFEGAVKAVYDGSGAVTVTIQDSGTTGILRIEKESTDTAVELEPNKLYIFPEMVELTITLAEPSDTGIANEYHFVFQSGATATTLSIPDTVKLPSSFSVDVNKIYELSVMENCLTYQSWDVSASA